MVLSWGAILRKTVILPIIIGLSLVFNIGFIVGLQGFNEAISWPFIDLGPAVMQDSYLIRAPGLESPFGMIGDIPGGYPLYLGNPLLSEESMNNSASATSNLWNYGTPAFDTNILVIILCFAIIPIFIVVVLGRRSYGSSKTQ